MHPMNERRCTQTIAVNINAWRMIMKTLIYFSLMLTIVTIVMKGNATNYYVASNGDDSYPGTFAQPWKTIQKAASTASAGDTVFILGGVYRERVALQRSGLPSQFIAFVSYQQQNATIDGAGITVPQYSGLLDLSGQNYIVISGLRVINSNEAGILADGTQHIVIERCSTYNTASSGIGVWNSADAVIRNNRVERACTNGMQECISVAGTATFDVYENFVVNCKKEGICPKDGSSDGKVHGNTIDSTEHVGIYVDAWDKHTFNIDVYNNVVRNIARKDGFMVASEQGGLLENVRLYNNISYNNGFNGIGLSACCPGAPVHPIRNITIINNTVYNNGLSGWGGGISIGENPTANGIVIRNNISSQNLTFQIAVDSIVNKAELQIDHNLIDGFRNGEGEVRGTSFVEADPQFINAASFDFHLKKSSPTVDAGSSLLAPSIDFDGNTRPSGKEVDIGCYEYLQATGSDDLSPIEASAMYLSQNFPNPFVQSTTMSYKLFANSHVRLEVFDLLGRKVATLVDEEKEAGEHTAVFDFRNSTRSIHSGVYVYQLRVDGARISKTMLVLE